MAKRKTEDTAAARDAATMEQPAQPAAQPQADSAVPAQGDVPAPPRGEGDAFTIDNRAGYRKEDSPDGRRRQIRFADRPDGSRPDDELLEPVRAQKPVVSWANKEKAWQARRNADGYEALDGADQQLADIGRKRRDSRGR